MIRPWLRALVCMALLALLAVLGAVSAHAQVLPPEQVKLELIQQMQADGLLSPAQAAEAKAKYVDPRALGPAVAVSGASGVVPTAHAPQALSGDAPNPWLSGQLSWTALLKLVAVAVLLVALAHVLGQRGLAFVRAVPPGVYQAVLLAASLLLTFKPQWLWWSEWVYLAHFGAVATLLVLGWIVDAYPALRQWLGRLNLLGLNAATWKCIAAMLYFGALALLHHSQLFGVLAVVSLSAVLNFALAYGGGVLALTVRERGIATAVWGHLALLLLYVRLKVSGHLAPQAIWFAAGVEHYATVALGVGLFLATAPFIASPPARRLAYLAVFAGVVVVASLGYHLFGLKVIGSIVGLFALLVALEWLGYLAYRAGFLLGTVIAGALLYGLALLVERFGGLVVLALP